MHYKCKSLIIFNEQSHPFGLINIRNNRHQLKQKWEDEIHEVCIFIIWFEMEIYFSLTIR